MKRNVLVLGALASLALGPATAAKAVDFNVGPGGVYVGPHRHHGYNAYNEYRGDDYRGRCRIVIDHHTNRFGEDVTVRRRVCD